MAKLQILVDIIAQEADAGASPPVEQVVVRGSETGIVLTNGKSYANFIIHSFSCRQRLGKFQVFAGSEQVQLQCGLDSIQALHDEYDLSSKKVVVRIAEGNDEANFNKPSTGNIRSQIFTYYGFIPNWFAPEPQRNNPDVCTVPLVNALAYTSTPLLVDKVDATNYPTAPSYARDALFPLLFGNARAFNTRPLFPMLPVGMSGNNQVYAIGNRPLSTEANGAFTQTYTSIDGNTASGTKNAANATLTRAGATFQPIWYYGNGLGVTVAEPMPGMATNDLVESGGQVLYWLMRYIGKFAAAALPHASFYGNNAPLQLRGEGVNKAGILRMVQRPIELAEAIEDICNEFLVGLRLVDGTRESAGTTPKWSIADWMIKKPSTTGVALPIDPGWLIPKENGELGDIRQGGVHPLYANNVNMRYVKVPAVIGESSPDYLFDTNVENDDDIDDRGRLSKELHFNWNILPRETVGSGLKGQGWASDRWGRWTKEDPVAQYDFTFRLPMGDILPGDILDFGSFADAADGTKRFFLVEETNLDWQAKVLTCRAARIKDAPEVVTEESVETGVRNTSSYDPTHNKYPPNSRGLKTSTDRLTAFYKIYHVSIPAFSNGRGAYYQFASDVDFRSLKVRFQGRNSNDAYVRLFVGSTVPPNIQFPYNGWENLANTTLLYTSSKDDQHDWTYTLTDAQVQNLAGKYIFITTEVPDPNNFGLYNQWQNPRLTFTWTYVSG